ncbi:MAG: prenyltransferase [Methanomicrobiaceae archaeon]|nr:prenyltransferase [Methanomicrobiaceae archaeon]
MRQLSRWSSFALSVSRFRFWIYTGGTYVVGYALGMDHWHAFLQPEYAVYLFYFFIPANILIYGVNDLWDEETDRQNPKKEEKEYKFSPADRKMLIGLLSLISAGSLTLLLFQDWTERAVFLAFLGLSYFYSARPLRFKEIPFLDFSANMLYIMPGIFGYYLAGGGLPPPLFVLGGYLHISAMHVFSAVPDIEYDRSAGITTTAVLLGERTSLAFCTLFWAILSLLVITLSGYHPLSVLVLLYPAVPLAVLINEGRDAGSIYWYLPFINTSLGGILFLAAAIHNSGIAA